MDTYDVIIIGGAAAGSSAALTLGRARRRVLVIDGGSPRNRFASGVHSYPGREGANPLELVADMRAEAGAYSVEYVEDTVVSVTGAVGDFTVTRASGTIARARRLIVATGLTDVLPDIPGLTDLWGEKVHHCPYCHGWEVRDQAIAVLAVKPGSGHQALLLTQWTDDLTVVGEAELDPEQVRGVEVRGGRVLRAAVTAVRRIGDRVALELADGSVLERDAVFVASDPRPNDALLRELGAETVFDPNIGVELVRVDFTGATSVPGVSAVGYVVESMAQVLPSAAAGSRAAAAINMMLVHDDVALAFAEGAA